MFRTKLSVDRHVQELFRKVKDENERTLRCYNVAKLYFQVQDYESARRYVSSYLEVKSDQAGPHKLLGEIYEALGQKESALAQYKQSLEIEPRQDDLVLKVCELLADMDIGLDVNRVRYWVDRADEKFPHHPTIFKLKEKILMVDRPNNGGEDLEALIAAELSARPSDVQLRVKLLKYYIDKSRLDDAYKHALQVESTHAHRDSVAWYEALCDLLSKCKDTRQSKWTFWIMYISALERYAALSLKEQGHVLKKTITEAAQAVFLFDQALTDAKLQNFPNTATFAEHMFNHMWGQLHYHLACLLLRKTKREQGSWNDTGRLCAPLLLTAMHVAPIDISAPWVLKLKDQTKSQIQVWHREGSYRCSQAGHVLQDYSRDDAKKLMDKIDKFCVGSWRERIYQRIFVSKALISTSYFANHVAPNSPLRLCSATELKIYDESAEEVWPASLHHHVWLGILKRPRMNRTNSSDDGGPHPHQYCHVFPDLQLSVFNLSQAAPDSLGQLDIDAFLNAAVLCASMVVEEQQRSGFLSPDRLPTLPADITNTLCTCTQDKWWSSAYKIYRKQDGISGDLGEIRQELQRGLEVVRCIGNHGLHPAILVHLARIFHHRAKMLKEKDKNHVDLPFVEARCELYWSAVVPLLERLLNNQAIRTTSSKMFDYQGKEMNNVELTNALEEGRLLLAQRYIRDKQHEQAIEALQALKCPEASFMQGEIYKSLADELMSTLPKESLTSAMRSQHVTTLAKARSCYYLTLDRLRSPGMNPKHPLNSELGSRIADIENDLKRIDPDLWQANRNDCDVISDADSYSSAHSGDAPVIQNSFNYPGSTIPMLSTPLRNTSHRTPKQASTPCRFQHHDVLELTRKSAQQEARPSPERLDAQLRQLLHSNDNLLQSILEQNKALLETNKSLVESSKSMNEKIEELQKQFADLRTETQQTKNQHHQQQQQRPRTRSISASRNNLDEDLYVINDDDYSDMNYSVPPAPAAQMPPNMFAQQPRHPYSPLVYPPATALQGYYPPMPFNDPHAHHIPPIYPPNVFQMPAIYPRNPMEGIGQLPKMSENMQGMFTQRLMNQLTDFPPPQQQPQQTVPPIQAPQLSMQLQNLDTTRNEIPAKDNQSQALSKDGPMNRAPPVNVVITTSDTLPTNVPTSQPMLSVTIPAQHRSGSGINVATTTATAPHSYQISMPLQAMIPTTVILPPLSTTITNTISASVAEQEKISHNRNSSIMSTGSHHNYSSDGPELEHDPLPDFVPVIPLPAEVQVTTGEENETSLFCARAKLYRWSDKEWKERGVGNVKLLKNADGKIRLVMRREQVLKICANHMLTPDMELTRMMNNDKAWIWVANDFADEEVKLEKLCIKFKFPEEAQSFKESFDRAKASVKASPVKPAASANKMASSTPTPATKTESKVTPLNLGGFSFTTKPIVQKPVTPEPQKTVKPEETTKPSPFAGFSFTKTTSDSPIQSGGFSFVKSTTTPTLPIVKDSQQVGTLANDASRTTLRRPHAPAPAELIANAKNDAQNSSHVDPEISGQLNKQGEAVVYESKANFMRCTNESGQWKNRGSATIKLILTPKTGKVCLSIRGDEPQKLFYDKNVRATTKFTTPNDMDNVVTWLCPDTTKATGKSETIAILFDSATQASHFSKIIGFIQRKLINDCVPASDLRQTDGRVYLVDGSSPKMAEKSLAEMFKPATDSWECTMCYTRNNGTAAKCVACENPAPGKSKPTNLPFAGIAEKPTPWSQFKPQPDSWECQSCYIRNTQDKSHCLACNTSKDPEKAKITGFTMTPSSGSSGFTFGVPGTMNAGQTNVSAPLSELFKPQAGSWECNGCMLRNNEATNYCAACETPKDPSMPAKSKTNIFGAGVGNSASTPTFSFGVPPKEAVTTGGGFSFTMPAADDKAAGDSGKTTNKPTFGMVFGTPQRPVTPPNTETTGFAFGSPGKSFDFQFSSTKSPAESPGRGDAAEDEVAESEDVYFAPVIPLPDKIDVKTGEENEEIVYSHRAKLFRYDANSKEWKERGLGDIKLLRHNETEKLRMVMRRCQTLKLCLNHFVTVDMELKPKDDKTWLWTAADYSEGDIECLQLACRFKTPEIADNFKHAVQQALGQLKTPSTDKTGDGKTLATSLQDIEVVYEVKVTNDEKEAALKLQLPENFYAYKRKDDCPGCLGCREPDVPLFEDSKAKTASKVTPKIAPPKFIGSQNASKTSDDVNPPTTTAASIFGGESVSKPNITFSTNSANFGVTKDAKKTEEVAKTVDEKKPTNFVFGSSSIAGNDNKTNAFEAALTGQSTKNSPFTSGTFTAENLSICSPTSATMNFGSRGASQQQPFGTMQSPFGAGNYSSAGQTSIFTGAPRSGTSIFGGNATVKSTQDNSATNESASPLAPPFQNIFGGSPKTTVASGVTTTTTTFGSGFSQPNFGSVSNATTVTTTPTTFETIANTGNLFGGNSIQTPSKLSFAGLASNNASLNTGNGNASDNSVDKKIDGSDMKKDGVNFLPVDNTATFSDLAAHSPQQPSFTKDPNFSFAGAGASVFGSKLASSVAANNSKSSVTSSGGKQSSKDDEAEDENEEDEGQDYDPHYEPIVPLPDAIEVRTGEEDEQKMFCQRSKLYRYESETKEWKERGTGEMKLLFHAQHGTYRLLLRREQVHKVVCNLLVTPDLELRALNSSDRAWMWAGVNHAEEPYGVEELAVKFKNPELAVQFKEAVEKAKLDIRERQASGQARTNESPAEYYADEQEDEGDEEEDDEEDEEHSMMFVSQAELFTHQGSDWTSLGTGILKILYDSEIYGAKIIVEVDYTGEIISNTIITMETTMENVENTCVWTAIDEVINPPTRRTLKAVFSTVQLAQNMYINYQDGQEYAKQADISEAAYYDPRIE